MFEIFEIRRGMNLGKCCKCGKSLPFKTDNDYVCLECQFGGVRK